MEPERFPIGVHLHCCKYYNYGKVNNLKQNHADPEFSLQETMLLFVSVVNDKYNLKVV